MFLWRGVVGSFSHFDSSIKATVVMSRLGTESAMLEVVNGKAK